MTYTTAETTAPVEAPEDTRYLQILLAVIMLAVMSFGSLMTIVTVALGEIGEDLGSSRSTMTWAITGLLLASAVATPMAGKLGDIHGHRRIFLIGLVGGGIMTFAAAFAWNAASLIAFRVIFGVFGAFVNPNAMAIMMHAYGPARRATAMGWFQFAMTGAPTIGLVAGGPLIEVIGWRAIFFVFTGVTALAFVAGFLLVRPSQPAKRVPLDYLGGLTLALAAATGLLAITRFTTQIREGGLSTALADRPGWLLTLVCAIGIFAFIKAEQHVPAPMLRLDYFGRRNFTMPMVSSAAVQFAYMGGFVVTPALLEGRYLWTVGAIALVMAPRPAAFSIASPIGGYLPSRVGLKRPIVWGAVLMIASMACFIVASPIDSGVGIALIVAGLMLSGVSAGISQPSVMAMIVDSVDEADMGIANGMGQQIMLIGIVVGIQTMNVLVGDDATGSQFAAAYAVGAVVAVGGLVTALMVRPTKA